MKGFKEFKEELTESKVDYLQMLKKEISSKDYNEFLIDVNEPDSVDSSKSYYKNAIGMIKNWMKEDDVKINSDVKILKMLKQG